MSDQTLKPGEERYVEGGRYRVEQKIKITTFGRTATSSISIETSEGIWRVKVVDMGDGKTLESIAEPGDTCYLLQVNIVTEKKD